MLVVRLPREWLLVAVLFALLQAAESERAGAAERPDGFAPALAEMGLSESDLGHRPKRHWNRYPHPRDVPHVLPFFEDLHAAPLDTYGFARTLGNVVDKLLTPEALLDDEDALFQLGVILATERRIGGFRGYSANLDPRIAEGDPLLEAILQLHLAAGKPIAERRAFGKTPDTPEKDRLLTRVEALSPVPQALREPFARYLVNLIDSRSWVDRGLRKVPQHQRDAVFDAVPDLAEGTSGGRRYFPAIDDVAELIDEHSLWYGCLKALQATQDARREIGAVLEQGAPVASFDVSVPTPWGTVAFSAGLPAQAEVADPLLVVRIDPNKPLSGRLGATGRRRPLSVALLLGDVPSVGCAEDDLTDCSAMSVASGILGCGVTYVGGDLPTRYRTSDWGLGAGLFGLGALVDEGGNDEYEMRSMGMGAAFFGAGLSLDAAGDDHYRLAAGDGQGFGGSGGIGILADRSGNDTYYAEPDASKAGRADYHSDFKVAVSFVQGVGVGRRGDGSDGHVWAGGLGALLDVDGNDSYRAGNFSQGTGYWLGTGLLWDGGGDDAYRSVFYTQGSGAHFAIGALIDESGNDSHVLGDNAGAAFGFGWDVVNAFLIDRGEGRDLYEARIDSIGMAMMRSQAFFLEEGGADTYVLLEKGKGLGDVDQRKRYVQPGPTSTFTFHLTQVGMFLDCGGNDRYLRRSATGAESPDPEAKDGQTWHVLERKPASRSGPNVSIGRDNADCRLGFLDPWPLREPAQPTD